LINTFVGYFEASNFCGNLLVGDKCEQGGRAKKKMSNKVVWKVSCILSALRIFRDEVTLCKVYTAAPLTLKLSSLSFQKKQVLCLLLEKKREKKMSDDSRKFEAKSEANFQTALRPEVSSLS